MLNCSLILTVTVTMFPPFFRAMSTLFVETDIIVKFALLELQYGSRERARTMFENLVASYPKRTDLLHVYLSQMIKANQPISDIR